ncbi:MAG: phosphotransferase family protein [Magnetovibrio sp.]|nr:phosphotransferase family protein [Magnetovibrio sp.]
MTRASAPSPFLTGAGEIPQDWPRLAEHLAEHGWRLDEDPPPRQFASGFGNLNFLVHLDGEPMVLRRPPLGPIQPGANDMGRESRILMRLWKEFPLAPRCHHFCEDPAVLGAPFFIMEYRPGLVIGGTMPDGLGDDAGAKLGAMMAEQLARFHAVDPAAVDLDGLGNPMGFAPRTLKGWTKRADAAWLGAPPADLAAVVEWLGQHVPEDAPPTLLHNDFKLDNIILDPDTLEPRALIDWDMGTRGDPLWDLAVLLSYWTEAGDPDAMIELDQMPTAAGGFPSREATARVYAEASGRDLAGFRFFRVLAVLRLAVIFRQLYRRFQEGGTDDPRFERFGGLADGLLAFAAELAAARRF